LIEGNLVDVRRSEIFPARVEHKDGLITRVERVDGEFDSYLVPGLVDAHIHIELSHLCPSRFAEVVVPHGTTSVVADPHEIANVRGVPGVEYMVRDSSITPLRTFFTAPSCVPATHFETSGAALGPEEIEALLSRDGFVALGEVMDYPAVVAGEPGVMAKIDVAKRLGKPVDGHCPLLSGSDLRRYVEAGITTDHECTSSEEALEKYRLGMMIMVRQGSASRNLEELYGFACRHEFILVSDDKSASDLLEGHVDKMLREAVALGMDPVHALRAATINPAVHYRLPVGVIEPGRAADIVRVSDLERFEVREVYIGGELVASGGSARFEARPKEVVNELLLQRKTPSDFEVMSSTPSATVKVIGVVDGEIVTRKSVATLATVDGRVAPDIEKDVARIAVVNRYHDAPVCNAFVSGFGLAKGAVASSVAHDSHNVIVVGVGSEDMAQAFNTLVSEGGGFCVFADGKATLLRLRVAGLMCTKPAFDVKRLYDQLDTAVRGLGCKLSNPFMTLSFLSLLVVPRLKIGDRGLFDVDRFEFTDVLSSQAE
jgi:adenine deaminase